MSRSTAVIAAALLLGACAKPIMVRIEVPDHVAAVSMHLKEGNQTGGDQQCGVPCLVQIDPKTTHELSVHAPGCYPAVMEIDYMQAMFARGSTGKDEPVLTVPLVKRPLRAPGLVQGEGAPSAETR